MGTMLEKFLTTSEEEFRMLSRDAPPLEQIDDGKREAYRYARVRPFRPFLFNVTYYILCGTLQTAGIAYVTPFHLVIAG